MRWTVYCRVVDNFGDIGFSWRLAADLAARGETVRLVADELGSLAWLAPQGAAGVTVARWPDAGSAVSDVVVETFGCGVPEEAVLAWRAGEAEPLHINVEHLSAEAFVERSHRLPSPPAAGMSQPTWNFYPGFTSRTGGLLREATLLLPGAQADADDEASHLPSRLPGERRVFAFCYETPSFARWLDRHADQPMLLLCAPGAATAQAHAWRSLHAENDKVSVAAMPFVSQVRFDVLLRLCDLNIVRGEDSLVRAIWAARPFIWHLYPQSDGAHRVKLEAFLDRFLEDAEPALAHPLRALMRAWNDADPNASFTWPAWAAWQAKCERFATRLARQPSLTDQLVDFAKLRLGTR